MQIHARLVEERDRLGLTQVEMAKTGGVAFRTYCDYEAGKSEPRASFLAQAAAAGVDVLYVLTGAHSGAQMAPEEEMVLAGYRKLDARGRAGVLGLISGMQPPVRDSYHTKYAGKVGQVIEGDYHHDKPLTINVGGAKKKAKRSNAEDHDVE